MIAEFFGPADISSIAASNGFNELLGTEYAVRAISVNSNRQVGVSDLSAGAAVNSTTQDVTAPVKPAISNVRLAGGVFEFDQTLEHRSLVG